MSGSSAVDKSPGKIRRMFDGIAQRYDLLNTLLSLGMDKRWRRVASSACADGDIVLDVACGTGDQAMESRRKTSAPVFAMDFSFEMLRLAKPKVRSLRIHLVCADARYMPFKDGAFDVISIAFGIRNIDYIGGFVAECSRVTKADARLVVLEFENPKNGNPMYELYMNSLMPVIGNTVSGTNAYSYLTKSVRSWLTFRELSDVLGQNGFHEIDSRLATFGAVRIITAGRTGRR